MYHDNLLNMYTIYLNILYIVWIINLVMNILAVMILYTIWMDCIIDNNCFQFSVFLFFENERAGSPIFRYFRRRTTSVLH